MASGSARLRVLVVGGGAAGLEVLLGLHGQGAGRIDLTLISASPSSRLFDRHPGRRRGNVPLDVDLAALCAALGVAFHLGETASVDPGAQTVRLRDGEKLGYDELVVACGAVPVAAYAGVTTLERGSSSELLHGLRAERLSIVVPAGLVWTLPAYELAVRAREQHVAAVEVITPERQPMEVFGEHASAAVGELLTHVGVELLPPAAVPVGSDLFTLLDAVVALPLARGPAIEGLPSDVDGFVPVDVHGRVSGTSTVHAVGDVTDRPLRQEGLAAQDARAVATGIVHRAGLGPDVASAPRLLHDDLSARDGRTVHLQRLLDGQDAGSAADVESPGAAAAPVRIAVRLAERVDAVVGA